MIGLVLSDSAGMRIRRLVNTLLHELKSCITGDWIIVIDIATKSIQTASVRSPRAFAMV